MLPDISVALSVDSRNTVTVALFCRAMTASSPPAIEVDDLVKTYGDVDAVRGVSFTVPPRRGLRLPRPQRRRQEHDDQHALHPGQADVRRRRASAASTSSASATTCAATSAWSSRTPRWTATSPPRRTCACTPSCTASTPASSRPGCDQMLEMVDLADRRDKQVMTFSGGMRRRLEIARGLMHSPRVLFLDEPTIGLDPQTRSSIWRYIRALQETEGTTIFMTTHYMDEAEFCDRIAIMDRGEIVVLDTPEALKAARRRRPRGAGHGRRRRGARRAARPLRHRGRGGRGRGDVPRRVRRGVRPAAVRRAGRRHHVGRRLAADARRRLHALHRLDDPGRGDGRRGGP